MKTTRDLGALNWTLAGWTPFLWQLFKTMELAESPTAELRGIKATVPGSVQKALRDSGLLPDWNLPENSRLCEWVENRQWIFEAPLPDDWLAGGSVVRLRADGLDYSGWVLLNGKEVGTFVGTHRVHVFDLAPHLKPDGGNRLQIAFDTPPRWLGQFGRTSQVREFKTRFNYTWDWQPRLVQIGVWDTLALEVGDGVELADLRCTADADPETGTGILRVQGRALAGPGARVRIQLGDGARTLREETLPATALSSGIVWHGLEVALWWPNGEGEQPLYTVEVALLAGDGLCQDRATRTVGFRNIVWRPCEGAPAGADPWLCVVNGRPVFLQGVNCPPLAPNFADVPDQTYRERLGLYRELGANTLRVNGVGFLEKEIFYDLCDRHGLLVWQDVPLSSSGVENVPPDDPESIFTVGEILRGFIARRQHHACLLLWCGGNELHERSPEGYGVPMTTRHPLIGHLDSIVDACDPGRRFLPTTATGPRFNADAKDFGKGIHGNVHGPWKLWGSMDAWRDYWLADDALFRAETGAPGAAPVEIIEAFRGDFDPMPVTEINPLWRRPVSWWVEDGAFAAENGRAPKSVAEYVDWSQARQAEALTIAVGAAKDRFPGIGGILLWCGHDCHPCPANTSIIDFYGQPKPAARALQAIWQRKVNP